MLYISQWVDDFFQLVIVDSTKFTLDNIYKNSEFI